MVYKLSSSAGLISNQIIPEKEDAVILGTERAKNSGLPVIIFELNPDEPKEDPKTILVCNPDGSVEKPSKDKHEIKVGFDAGFDAKSQSHQVVIASYGDQEISCVYLKSEFPETELSPLEKACECEVGLYEDDCLIVFSQEPQVLEKVALFLEEKGIEHRKITYKTLKGTTEESEDVVTAAATQYGPEKIPALYFTCGKGSRVKNYEISAQNYFDKKQNKTKYLVKVNGKYIGTSASAKTVKRLMEEEAQKIFQQYMYKTL